MDLASDSTDCVTDVEMRVLVGGGRERELKYKRENNPYGQNRDTD